MMLAQFPARRADRFFITHGGMETEIMFRYGHDLPEFSMYPLLDNDKALADMRTVFASYFEAASNKGCGIFICGLDYRASPDWATKIGYSRDALREYQIRSIDFLRDCAHPFEQDIPDIVISGTIGPKGDAYGTGGTITAEEAEDYHAAQLENLKAADADYALAATFNNIPEAVGVSRAAKAHGVPIAISFTLTSEHVLRSGPTLREAIEETDRLAGDDAPEFYTVNCSHPIEFEPALEPGAWIQRLRGFMPNAAKMDKIALCKLGHLEEGDPVELGEMMGDLARRYPHMDIFGGCCGTCQHHLELIADNVSAQRR
jgi:S-methylmethionine-dependent homocysteine/selenocysteine methylase